MRPYRKGWRASGAGLRHHARRMTAHVLPLLVLMPLAAAAVLMGLPERFAAAARMMATAVIGSCLLAALPLVANYNPKSPDVQFIERFGSGVALLGLDGMSLLFLIAVLVMAAVAAQASEAAPGSERRHASGWLLLAAGAGGVLASLNIGALAAFGVLTIGGLTVATERPERSRGGLPWLPAAAWAGSLLVITAGGAASGSGGRWLIGLDLSGFPDEGVPLTSQWLIMGGSLGLLASTMAALLVRGVKGTGDRASVLAGSVLLVLAVSVFLRVALPLAPVVSRSVGASVTWACLAAAIVCGAVALFGSSGPDTVAWFGASQTALVVAGAATLIPDGLSGAMVRQPVVSLSMVALACLGAWGARADLEGAHARGPLRARLLPLAIAALALLVTEGGSMRTGTRLQLAAGGAESAMVEAVMEVAGVLALFAAWRLAYSVWSGVGGAGPVTSRSASVWGLLPGAVVVGASLVPGPVLERVTVPALKVAARLDASYKGAFDAACDTTVTDEMKAANPANQFLSAAPCGPNGEPLEAGSSAPPGPASAAGR